MRTRHVLLMLLAFTVFGMSLPTLAQVVTATIPAGIGPFGVAVNPATNKIYVANLTCDVSNLPCPSPGTVTVIDGATNSTATVNVGVYPYAIAVNPTTNKVYVANACGNDVNCQSLSTVIVIDGATNNTVTVNAGAYPYSLSLNSATNQIYVANNCGNDLTCSSPGTVTVIDGATNNTATVTVGNFPEDVEVNSVTNQIYVVNNCGGDNTCNSSGTVTVINGNTNNTATVNVGAYPYFGAVDAVTNQIYVTNNCGNDITCSSSGTITVIDGSTLNTTTVNVGVYPYGVAVDAVTNNIYVANQCGDDTTCGSPGTVTVVNGNNNNTLSVGVGVDPYLVAVDSVTNKIYVPNLCGGDLTCMSAGTVSVIDGATNNTTPVTVGDSPESVAINSVTNLAYVPNFDDGTVSVIGGATKLQLVSVPPCRLVDTRQADGTFGGPIMQGNTVRSFPIPQNTNCNIPSTAAAYSLNVTVVPLATLGYLTIWPTQEIQPVVSTLNSPDGRTKANAAVVPAGVGGGVSVYVTDTTNVILDIDGYFAPATSNSYEFFSLPPCRLVDTRQADGELGGPRLAAQTPRDFPLLLSACIPTGVHPLAYSLNFTVVPNPGGQPLGYLSVWPAGEQQPVVSTLNNPTATVVANAAIVPAGSGGDIDVYAYNTTDLLIDINGYFAAPGTGGYSFYPTAPCRAYDSRNNGGQPFTGERTLNIMGSTCAPPSNATGYVFNATVVPSGSLGYLTLWPDGETQPVVSTLNAYDGFITSNMAIVPTNNGSIDAYAAGLTQLILDISGYFAP
jgi:DNA-binding beta-propeller fold protein YncE